MRPYAERAPDGQYQACLQHILEQGELIKTTPQGVGAITSMTVPKMAFRLENGFPIIPDRDISSFWRKPIDELFAFIRGEITFTGLKKAGCGWWDQWKSNALRMGLGETLGPASYGAAFHNFPMPDGNTFNQFRNLVNQLKDHPEARTHFVTPWIPFWLVRGEDYRAAVAPCHGWVHCRNINGKLSLHMFQRSADFPVGVPSNMTQYAALTLVLADILKLKAWEYVHSFSDAHIYEDQVDKMRELIARPSVALPSIRLVKPVTDLFEVDSSWFELSDYHPHPAMQIPVAT